MNGPPRNKTMVKLSAFTNARLILALIPGDLTIADLVDETGLHRVTIERYCKEMHKVGAVHVVRWEPDARGRHNVKIYKLGLGKDARRVRMSDAERRQRARDKLNAQRMQAVLAGKGRFVASANHKLRYEEMSCAS